MGNSSAAEINDRPGFFIPYRYAAQTRPRPAPAWLMQMFASAEPSMCQWLGAARSYTARLREFAHAHDQRPHQPRFDQDWFTGLDATLAYTVVRELAPARIVEVGSGHSTRFMAQAIADGGLQTHLHSIDPQPRRAIDELCATVSRVPLAQADDKIFASLAHNDILFVDGSHIFMPGSDVDQIFVEVVPQLKAGVLVHVHDIFLPGNYPSQWDWRSYNEQGLLAALLGTGRFDVIAASAYLTYQRPELLEAVYCPLASGFASSLWLRIGASQASP